MAVRRIQVHGQTEPCVRPQWPTWLLSAQLHAAAALGAITAAVSEGDPTPSEDADLVKLVDGFTRTLEATVFEERVARLERAAGIPATDSGRGAQASQCPPDRAHDQGAAP
jgi:hypothetical protein